MSQISLLFSLSLSDMIEFYVKHMSIYELPLYSALPNWFWLKDKLSIEITFVGKFTEDKINEPCNPL